MAIYSLARRTTNVTTSNAAIELIAGAANRCKVLEIGIFLAAATTSTFGLGRPGSAGNTPTSPVTVLGEDPNDTGTAKTALAWGTSPTDPTNFFRRISLPATIGTGVIWTFPRGIILAINATLVVQNIGATGVADVYFVIDE